MEMGVLNDFLQAAIPWMAMGFVVALTLATSVLASGATASAAAGAQAASTPAGARASQAASTPAGALTDEGEGDANE